MRLSLVISSMNAGGAERVMSTLANTWASRGWEIELITTHDGANQPHYRLDPRIRLLSVDPRKRGALKQFAIVRELRSAVRRSRPDTVISFLNYTNILTLMACGGLGCPVIVSERLDPRVVGIGPVWSVLRRLTYRRAALLVAQTPTAAACYASLAPGRIRVIPNPVVQPAESATWDSPDVDANRPIILAVGRLHPQKGFDLAVRAMAQLEAGCDDWCLVILGEGSARRDLENLRDQLGLRERIQMPGSVSDPWPWLKRAGIFLMSSRSEGFPNALCEAMAAGLPVISTDCPSGPADIITPEVDGLLVPNGDPAALAAAMQRLMMSTELRTRLAAAAPRVIERYSLESVLAAWDIALNEAVSRAASTGQSRGIRP